MSFTFDTRLNHAQPTASSLRVVGIKATPAGRARDILHDIRTERDLDPVDRTRTRNLVAAPEIVAQDHGSPEIDRRTDRVVARGGRRRHATQLQCTLHVIQCNCLGMQKDFDRWNKTKKKLNAEVEPLYFREGEIWWVHLGVNIGYEMDGKRENFARPVIVLRKYNKYSFLALPLTTSPKSNAWKLPVGDVGGKQAFAVISQLRNIDSRRLYQKISWIAPEQMEVIRAETLRANLGGL